MSIKYDNLHVDLICATITHESARTWRLTVASPAGALGLMQIMPQTGKFLSRHEGIEWTKPEEVLFEETRGYVAAVLKLYDAYKN